MATSADNFEHLPTRDPSSADLGDVVDQAIPRALDDDESWSSAAFLPPRVAGYVLAQDVPLGRGGGGTVWLFQPIGGGDLVVVKVPRPEALEGDGRERFEREREKLLKLRNENIVQAREPVEAELLDGTRVPALVMEYVSGELLSEYIERAALSRREVLELFERICGAVAALHHVGLVHLDLKPANIKVRQTPAGPVPVILDLGSSRVLLDRETRHSGLTLTFASPEQLEQHERRIAKLVDTSSDVYSLAKILAWLLGGDEAVEAPRTLGDEQRLKWLQAWSPRRMAGLARRCEPRILRVIADATRPLPADRLRAWRVNRERTSSVRVHEHAIARDLCDAVSHARRPWWRRLRAGWLGFVDAFPVSARRLVTAGLLCAAACVAAVLVTNGVVLAGAPLLRPWLSTVSRFDHVRVVLFPAELEPADVLDLASRLGVRTPIPTRWPTWRPMYGAIGELCAEAGARVVGFDVEIGENPDFKPHTADLAVSVGRMLERNCHSVFGLSGTWNATPPASQFAPDLGINGASHGCFETVPILGGGRCIAVRVERDSDGELAANAFSTELVLASMRAALGASGAHAGKSARVEADLDRASGGLKFLGRRPQLSAGSRANRAEKPVWLTRIDTFDSIKPRYYRDLPAEEGRIQIQPSDTIGLLCFVHPERPLLRDITMTVGEFLAKSPEDRATFVDGKVVLLANASRKGLTGPIESAPDMEIDLGDDGRWWSWISSWFVLNEDVATTKRIPKVWNHAVATELMLDPPARTHAWLGLLVGMLIASAAGVALGRTIARRHPGWARDGGAAARSRAARWTVVVTFGAVASSFVLWGLAAQFGASLPYDAVLFGLAAALGLLLGWLAGRLRALSNSFDAWLDGPAAQ